MPAPGRLGLDRLSLGRKSCAAIDLANGDVRLRLTPAQGGSVASLTWRGRPILRPTAEHERDPMRVASFPLAPFANRIAHGRFVFAGRHVRLKRNYAPEKHPLHGYAWLAPWRVEAAGKAEARLSLDRVRSDWPWAFACTQTISVSEDGADFVLTVRNTSDAPMPLSFGFHPAFVRPPGATLKAKVRGAWGIDGEMLPTELAEAPALPGISDAGAALDGASFADHCHVGWDGSAELVTPDFRVRITASRTLGFLHLYVPAGGDFLCIEPVSAMPDAPNRSEIDGAGLLVLAPGESASGSMRLTIGAPGG